MSSPLEKSYSDHHNGNSVAISIEKGSSDMGLFFTSSNPDIDGFRIEFICAGGRSLNTHSALSGIVHGNVQQPKSGSIDTRAERVSDEVSKILRLIAHGVGIEVIGVNNETGIEISVHIPQEPGGTAFRSLMEAMKTDNRENPIPQ